MAKQVRKKKEVVPTTFADKYLKPFFMASKKKQDVHIRPLYFWATIFLGLDVLTVITQVILVIRAYVTKVPLQADLTAVIGILSGLVVSLISVYNVSKKRK